MDEPKFDANNSDDVIFGGLGGERLPNYPMVIGHRNSEEPPFGQERGIAGDFLHGGAGDDAIAGGEAIWNGYTQLFNRDDRRPAAQRLPHRLDAPVQPGRPAALRRGRRRVARQRPDRDPPRRVRPLRRVRPAAHDHAQRRTARRTRTTTPAPTCSCGSSTCTPTRARQLNGCVELRAERHLPAASATAPATAAT